VIAQKQLLNIGFKQLSRGLVSPMDWESLDTPQDCFAEGVNVEINDPIGAITRSPGYYSSETSFPSPNGYNLKYFARWSVDKPTSQELLLLYYKSDTGTDFKIYLNPSGVWAELTQTITLTTGQVSSIDNTYLELDVDAPDSATDGFYDNYIIENVTKNQFAFVWTHLNRKLFTVEDLTDLDYSWDATNDSFVLHKSSLTAYYSSSLSDITAFAFIELLGRLRIATGIGTNAVAQWFGYLNSSLVRIQKGGDNRNVTMSGWRFEPLNKVAISDFDVVADGGSYTAVQVVITGVDIEGQEIVLCHHVISDTYPSIAALNGTDLNLAVKFHFQSLLNRFIGFNVYANSDLNQSIYFLQGGSLFKDVGSAFSTIKIGEDTSTNTAFLHYVYPYIETGRLLYYSPLFSAETKTKAIKYHKGRTYVISSDNEDYVRFTQFNTNAAETHDYFPYDEASGYGYFIVSTGDADKITAISITKDNNLLISKANSSYVYVIQNSNAMVRQLITLFSGIGTINQNTIDDTSDSGTFFADYRGIYLYVGGLNTPQRLLLGRLEKWYQSLPSTYKDLMSLKYNKQRDELWILLQVSGAVGSLDPTNYRILVYSQANQNFKMLQATHLITLMDNNRIDNIIEILANNKVQKWDYSASKVFTHDGELSPEPYIRTHVISPDITKYGQVQELYAEYDADSSFTLQPFFDKVSSTSVLNKKTFQSTKAKDSYGVRIGTFYYKLYLILRFGLVAVRQQINEFGASFLPSGGVYESRKTR
jgi:hypothetical protein